MGKEGPLSSHSCLHTKACEKPLIFHVQGPSEPIFRARLGPLSQPSLKTLWGPIFALLGSLFACLGLLFARLGPLFANLMKFYNKCLKRALNMHISGQCTFGKDVSQDYNTLKKLFLSTGWTKVRNFFPQNLTLLRTKITFFLKVYCNAPMHCKIHFTVSPKVYLGSNI